MIAPRLNSILQRLAALCTRLGGTLELMTRSAFDAAVRASDISVFPYGNHAVSWPEKRVLVVETKAVVQTVIHEMAHVFASRIPPNDWRCDEWKFLGWEIAAARHVRAFRAWDLGMRAIGYETPRLGAWDNLFPYERRQIIEGRLAAAEAAGLIDEHDRLRSVR